MTVAAESARRLIALEQMIPSPEATACLAESVARRLHVVPLAIRKGVAHGTLVVACENPSDQIMVDRLARRLPEGMRVKALPCLSGQLRDALDRCYAPFASDGQLVNRCQVHATTLKSMQGQPDIIVRLLDCILLSASRKGTSDIHLSPQKRALHIRFRIDGVMRSFAVLDKSFCSGLLVRIKILASMDIAETRCPQDGQFSQVIDADDIDFRVSCFPTISGQNTVLRLLDRKCRLDTLQQLNLSAETDGCLRALVQRPDGLLLVCGPTGSGKSTTLHALLGVRDAASLNIMTLEDPVERSVDGIRQSSIDASNGLDFSQGVRALLRQDPDVLLIGEIRDTPSCAMALRAVMSGHQVLTTVHARSVLAGLSRLRELGGQPSILADNLVAIASQRLVRKCCLVCQGRKDACAHCLSTGFQGRQLVLELLVVTPTLAQLIAAEATHQELLDCALQEGFIPLRQQGLKLVAQGVTTMDELDRVFGRAL